MERLFKISFIQFSIVIFLYQLIFVFHGINGTDEGFYATFYQQIFNDPNSVQYNFMYWLSGILGGSFLYLLPETGIIGLRILGVLVTTATAAITYRMLQHSMDKWNLKLGLFLVIIFISNDPKELYYNNLSALIFVFSVSFLFKGVIKNSLFFILISGVLIGLNVFVRLPNILAMVLGSAIIFNGFIQGTKIKKLILQVVIYLAGSILSIGGTLLFMRLIGHLDIFIESIRLVTHMSKSSENSHGLLKLINLFISQYTTALLVGAFTVVSIVIIAKVSSFIKSEYNINYSILIPLSAILILIFAGNNVISHHNLILFYTGLSLTIAFLSLIVERDNKYKLLIFFAILMVLIHPFGSDKGIMTVGKYSLWLIIPVGVNAIVNLKAFNSQNIIVINQVKRSFSLTLSSDELNSAKTYLLTMIVALSFFFGYFYPFGDKGNRLIMTSSIDSKYLTGVYTTENKAIAINDLLLESAKYVKKDDAVIVYHSFPLFHYMTESRPFLPNSWIRLYDKNSLKENLHISLSRAKSLPVIIQQKLKNDSVSLAENSINLNTLARRKRRNDFFANFLNHFKYMEVWSNSDFKILVSSEKLTSKSRNEFKISSF